MALADLELEEAIARQSADRLPGHEVAGLLRELTVTVRGTAADEGGALRWARSVRGALAGLLRRDIEATAAAGRHLVFDADLHEVRLSEPGAFTGPLPACAVLDLAAADAAAGLPLAERLRAWPRIGQADAHLRARLLAAHLAARPPRIPGPGTAAGPRRCGEVVGTGGGGHGAAAGRRPDPGPPGRPGVREMPARARADLERRARAVLGPAPAAAEVEQVLPAGAGRVDGGREPLASWLRVWDWPPGSGRATAGRVRTAARRGAPPASGRVV
ncbi:hypothetical protein AB0N77_21975 [Streptomyces misionensis]|uniref:hypothetical protein n=1 Tax=Streptomyces misionensis TaxID=67331 RepID=UPI003436D46F